MTSSFVIYACFFFQFKGLFPQMPSFHGLFHSSSPFWSQPIIYSKKKPRHTGKITMTLILNQQHHWCDFFLQEWHSFNSIWATGKPKCSVGHQYWQLYDTQVWLLSSGGWYYCAGRTWDSSHQLGFSSLWYSLQQVPLSNTLAGCSVTEESYASPLSFR